jgi:hypothetical protein
MKITVTYEHSFSPYKLYSPQARKIDDIIWDNIDDLPKETFDKLNDELGKLESRYRKKYKIYE